MRLWLIERDEDTVDYDEAAGFVVRAETESDALDLAASWAGDEGGAVYKNREHLTITDITVNGKPGIILRDFNAC